LIEGFVLAIAVYISVLNFDTTNRVLAFAALLFQVFEVGIELALMLGHEVFDVDVVNGLGGFDGLNSGVSWRGLCCGWRGRLSWSGGSGGRGGGGGCSEFGGGDGEISGLAAGRARETREEEKNEIFAQAAGHGFFWNRGACLPAVILAFRDAMLRWKRG
jgi:hypothetical protein